MYSFRYFGSRDSRWRRRWEREVRFSLRGPTTTLVECVSVISDEESNHEAKRRGWMMATSSPDAGLWRMISQQVGYTCQ